MSSQTEPKHSSVCPILNAILYLTDTHNSWALVKYSLLYNGFSLFCFLLLASE